LTLAYHWDHSGGFDRIQITFMCTARLGMPPWRRPAQASTLYENAMSIVEQVLQSARQERRAIVRTRIKREALLLFDGQADVFPCCVRDVTTCGAGIHLDGLNILPVEFYLSLCRMIWRDLDFIGAAFELCARV
jgi:hypothetical protein